MSAYFYSAFLNQRSFVMQSWKIRISCGAPLPFPCHFGHQRAVTYRYSVKGTSTWAGRVIAGSRLSLLHALGTKRCFWFLSWAAADGRSRSEVQQLNPGCGDNVLWQCWCILLGILTYFYLSHLYLHFLLPLLLLWPLLLLLFVCLVGFFVWLVGFFVCLVWGFCLFLSVLFYCALGLYIESGCFICLHDLEAERQEVLLSF